MRAHGLLLEAAGEWLRRVTSAWQQARITNFDYLLYLNLAAGEHGSYGIRCGMSATTCRLLASAYVGPLLGIKRGFILLSPYLQAAPSMTLRSGLCSLGC